MVKQQTVCTLNPMIAFTMWAAWIRKSQHVFIHRTKCDYTWLAIKKIHLKYDASMQVCNRQVYQENLSLKGKEKYNLETCYSFNWSQTIQHCYSLGACYLPSHILHLCVVFYPLQTSKKGMKGGVCLIRLRNGQHMGAKIQVTLSPVYINNLNSEARLHSVLYQFYYISICYPILQDHTCHA